MSDEVVFLDTKNLDSILKALKGNMSLVRVGILGGKTMRNNQQSKPGKSVNASKGSPKGQVDASTNAALGVIHEFGTDKMPMRSFLRVPISEHLQGYIESSGLFSKAALKEVVKQKSFIPWLKSLGTIGELIVSDAFATGGFGKWPKWKTKGYSNNTGQLLVDTQQLRNSISSEVKG